MNLDIGSGGGIYEWKPRAEICLSWDLPRKHGREQIVKGDAHYLPFRDKSFNTVFVFNVLEHLKNPHQAISEIRRVSLEARIRQDGILNLASYATPEHFWLQLPNLRFVKYPRTRIGIWLSQALRVFLSNKSRLFRFLLPPNQQYEIVLK